MMRKGKKIIFVLSFGWIFAFALAACGGGEDSREKDAKRYQESGQVSSEAASETTADGTLDAVPRRLKSVTTDSDYTEYQYDSSGNLILEENYAPERKELLAYTKYTYNASGKLLTEKRYRCGQSKDADDELISLYRCDYTGSGEPLSIFSCDYEALTYTREEYQYAPSGNLTGRCVAEGRLTERMTAELYEEEKVHEIEYFYDGKGRVDRTEERHYNKTKTNGPNHLFSGAIKRKTYSYDNLGNLIRCMSNSNEVEEYTYDWKTGGCLSYKRSFKDKEFYDLTEFVNDAEGRPVSSLRMNRYTLDRSQHRETSSHYFYDSTGLLITVLEDVNDSGGEQVSVSLGGGECPISGELCKISEKYYNIQGQLIGVIGESLGKKDVRCEFSYDEQGRLTRYAEEKDGGNSYDLSYDEKGRLIRVTRHACGRQLVCWARVYNAEDELIEYTLVPSGTTDIYTYDRSGTPIKRENGTSSTTWHYQYDADGRLLSCEQRDDLGNGRLQTSFTRYEYYN